jgi:FAD/FMN-containing dehydrogenase
MITMLLAGRLADRVNLGAEYVTVGAGAMWSDLIKYLNDFGKAPRTLQSYASFSVGGIPYSFFE